MRESIVRVRQGWREGSAHGRSGGETDLVGKKVPTNSLNQN